MSSLPAASGSARGPALLTLSFGTDHRRHQAPASATRAWPRPPLQSRTCSAPQHHRCVRIALKRPPRCSVPRQVVRRQPLSGDPASPGQLAVVPGQHRCTSPPPPHEDEGNVRGGCAAAHPAPAPATREATRKSTRRTIKRAGGVQTSTVPPGARRTPTADRRPLLKIAHRLHPPAPGSTQRIRAFAAHQRAALSGTAPFRAGGPVPMGR